MSQKRAREDLEKEDNSPPSKKIRTMKNSETTNSNVSLIQLSQEIFHLIFEYLNFPDMLHLALTSPDINEAFKTINWKRMYTTTFHISSPDQMVAKEGDNDDSDNNNNNNDWIEWKELYMNRYYLYFYNIEIPENPAKMNSFPLVVNSSSLSKSNQQYYDFWQQFLRLQCIKLIVLGRMMMNDLLEGRIKNNFGRYHLLREPSWEYLPLTVHRNLKEEMNLSFRRFSPHLSKSEGSNNVDIESRKKRQRMLYHELTFYTGISCDWQLASYMSQEDLSVRWVFYHPETSRPIQFFFHYAYGGDNSGDGSVDFFVSYKISDRLDIFPFLGDLSLFSYESIKGSDSEWTMLIEIWDYSVATDKLKSFKKAYRRLLSYIPNDLDLIEYIKTVGTGPSKLYSNAYVDCLDELKDDKN